VQPSIWTIHRPWYLAWAGLVYIVAAVATLSWIATSRRGAAELAHDDPVDVARHR